jgi:hypothetical protein
MLACILDIVNRYNPYLLWVNRKAKERDASSTRSAYEG